MADGSSGSEADGSEADGSEAFGSEEVEMNEPLPSRRGLLTLE